MKRYFEGRYYKHQTGGHILSVISGVSDGGAFVQVITEDGSFHVPYGREAYVKGAVTRVGKNLFSSRGICLNIRRPDICLAGELRYTNLTPPASDIMGPFRFLPMECRHEVVSIRHRVDGRVVLNGKTIDFSNGLGYIEGDSGRSFPESYFWAQCCFQNERAVMASAAKIPLAGFRFWGCVSALWLNGREFRLATYNGAKILRFEPARLTLAKGPQLLDITILSSNGKPLAAPQDGAMSRTIQESAACRARFVFKLDGATLMDQISSRASHEFTAGYVMPRKF